MIDAAVVGAGPAGLAASVALADRGVEHVVLERDRVAGTWRAQRWDSFRLNTAGWMNPMLGEQRRDAYAGGREVVERLEQVAAGCPVREGVAVARLAPTGDGWALATDHGALLARAVVVATGDQHLPRVPALASWLPGRVAQLHAADYRGPGQLPAGAVLVVGSAQSGCQITEDLLAACRSGTEAPSRRVGGPGRLHGQRPRDLPDPSMMFAAMAIVAPGRGLRRPARAGARLVGRPVAVAGERVAFDPGSRPTWPRGRRGPQGPGHGRPAHRPPRPARATRPTRPP